LSARRRYEVVGYVMDTSAWIEFFRGSSEGKKVTEYLFPEPTEIAPSITSTLVITEMRSVYIRDGKENKFTEDLERIRALSQIDDKINEKRAITAGTRHGNDHTKENNISYVDCILWTLAEELDMKVLSTDPHFKDCPHAVFIRKRGDDEV
jgi:predicted nucleic acid-binding protein